MTTTSSWLHPFYLIVDEARWLERFLPLGLRLVQLRIKDKSDDEVRAEIRHAKALCDAFGATLVINDYWQMAIDEGCDFIHLGQEDLDTADLAAIRANGLRLGVSTHDHEELARAMALKPDYVALGPIFPTILKKMAFGPQGVEKIAEWKKLIGDIPLIAIGGMKVENAAEAYAMGADSVSAVTDVLLHDAPENRLKAWLALKPSSGS